MTEAEWLTRTDPDPMLRYLHDRTTGRKARLLACGAARLAWEGLSSESSRRAVEVGEEYADERADGAALGAALQYALMPAMRELHGGRDEDRVVHSLLACSCVSGTVEAMWGLVPQAWVSRVPDVSPQLLEWSLGVGDQARFRRPSAAVWCYLIRDIFGNPFRPTAFDPRWRTSDAVGLARGIYEERAFDRLPLLADALMDAGCADEQVLSHCRSNGPHSRGCFVVDMVLGKE